MRFGFTKEQDEFRASLRRALEARSPTKEVRRLMATDAGWDRDAWRKLNQELGLTAIHIPEAYGGQGFGYCELGIVLEEMGRALVCAPFFSTAAALETLRAASRGSVGMVTSRSHFSAVRRRRPSPSAPSMIAARPARSRLMMPTSPRSSRPYSQKPASFS